MMYKIIHDGQTIDVVRNPNFLRFLSSGHIAITDKSSAQGIVGSDTTTIYSFVPLADSDILVVTIESINTKEFNRLNSLLNSKQKVSAFDRGLLKAKEDKIKMLSDTCKAKITDGFTIILTDCKRYSFKLTAEDQINLLRLENQLNAGGESFVYHATGLPCQIFVRDDMKKIINAYRKHVLYHTTYFNSAKQYINTLSDISKVEEFTYGIDITCTVKDPALRQIIQDGGAN